MNYVLLGISVVIFVVLVVTVWVKFGVQKSISASYYCFKPKYRWVFSVALIGFSFPVIIISSTPLMFIAGAFITFVAIAANYNSSETALRSHIIYAMCGAMSGMLSVLINFNEYYLIGVAVIVGLVLFKFTKNYIWWVEISAYITIIIGLFLSL